MKKYLVAVAWLLCCSLAAQQPKLGLVLSGGGAKGLAHIGVLQELEKAGIYPDVVSGTSMGSIVGGLYSIGYDPSTLNQVVRGIRWNDYFSDTYPSAFTPIEERRRSVLYLVSFPVENGKIGAPKGLLQGRKIQTLLAQLSIPAMQWPSFDDYPLPFRAVATDIVTGEAYVFRSGLLHQAIRASMAIPSVFSPVVSEDGRLLVDGLVVRNLPVQECLEMGADATLAVDVGTPLLAREELNSLLKIVEQTASFGSAIYNKEQRALADILIDPMLEPYSALDYGAADSIIALGAATARREMPRILAQLDSLGFSLPMAPPHRQTLQLDSFFVSRVEFKSETPASTRILEKLLSLQTPGIISSQSLREQIGHLYGSGFFSLVDFYLSPDETEGQTPASYVLVLSAQPAPDWRMRLSLAYDSDYAPAFLANLTGLNVIGKGSVLALDVRLSENPRIAAEYLLYNHTRPSIGLRSMLAVNFHPGRIYTDNNLSSDFTAHHYNALLSVFSGQANNRYLEAGFLSEYTSLNPRIFSLSNASTSFAQQQLFLEFVHDSFDRLHFPLKGSQSRLYLSTALSGKDQQGNEQNTNIGGNLTMTARHENVWRLHEKVVLLTDLAGGFINHQQANILNQLYLGRALPHEPLFFNAYGQRFMELAVSGFATATMGFRVEVGQENYISLHYQYGHYAQSTSLLLRDRRPFLDPLRQRGHFQGFALGLGSATRGGPVLFNIEYNPDLGRLNYNLHVGYYF